MITRVHLPQLATSGPWDRAVAYVDHDLYCLCFEVERDGRQEKYDLTLELFEDDWSALPRLIRLAEREFHCGGGK